MNHVARQSRSAFRLIAGWFGLLLYAFAATSLGPAIAAVLGSFDASHRVQFGCGNTGMQVVLHHNADCAHHQHGNVARTLTLFTLPTGWSNPDHILKFTSADSFAPETKFTLPSKMATLEFNFASIGAPMLPSGELRDSAPPSPQRDAGEAFPCGRSTVLLI